MSPPVFAGGLDSYSETITLTVDHPTNALQRSRAIWLTGQSPLLHYLGALNTDWEQEGGAKDRLKVAADSFRLEGLVVDGVRLGVA